MLVIACGLVRETKLMTAPGVTVIAGGGDGARLERELEAAAVGASLFLSSGLAGALDPALVPGDVVIDGASDPTQDHLGSNPNRHPREGGDPSPNPEALAMAQALGPRFRGGDDANKNFTALFESLRAALPNAYVGRVLGSDTPIATVAAKAEAYRSGAIAVDMETHIARRVADRHGLPWLVVRVISDGANHALPPAALAGMRPDGGIALGAVLASLARHPSQLPALIRTGRDAETAFRTLGSVHRRLRDQGAFHTLTVR